MYSRDINELTDTCKAKYLEFDKRMRAKKLDYIVTCTSRLERVQLALFAQGRYDLKSVNVARHSAQLPPITDEENKRKVTWTLTSKHVVNDANPKARAFDIALKKDGKVHYDVKVDVNDDMKADYLQLGEIAKEVGLTWGGYFKTAPDYPHFEE